MLCPRRDEIGPSPIFKLPAEDSWINRDGHKRCSYCGSLHPDEFMAALEAGERVVPTDKNYKAYLHLPNPDAGKTVKIGSSTGPVVNPYTGEKNIPDPNFIERLTGRYDRPIMGVAGDTKQVKFYFQHLSVMQRRRIVDMLNAKSLMFAEPGYFYVPPFFVEFAKPKTEAGNES